MSIFGSIDWHQRRKLLSNSWYEAVVQGIKNRVDAEFDYLNLPEKPGGWIHKYIHPTSWMPLVYDGHQPTYHATSDGAMMSGEDYDGGWRAWRHRELADWARDAGILYHLLEDSRYADAITKILLDYTTLYTRFRGDTDAEDWMLKGHAFNQALTEALWAVPLVQAYDLIRDTLSADDNQTIVDQLLRPIADTLSSAHDNLINQNRLDSNYTAWLLAGLGQLAFALDDKDLIGRVTSDKIGFPAHIDCAIFADGMEHEATPYYHNFVSLAYSLLAESFLLNDVNLYEVSGSKGQTIDSLWNALAQISYADGSIPDANDGSYWVDSIYDIEICDVYEMAFARTGKPLYGWLAKQAYQRRGVRRDRWTTLLFANDDLPNNNIEYEKVTILPDSGMIVARPSSDLQLFIPYGAYAGSHSHYDRLALTVRPFSRDAGTTLYGIEERVTWYQQTLAHNTVVVDEKSQGEGSASLIDQTSDSLSLRSDTLYDGVSQERRVQWTENCIDDTFSLKSETSHQYDWLFHSDGQWIIQGESTIPLAGTYSDDAPGSYVNFEATIEALTTVTLQTSYEGKVYQLTLNSSQPMQIILANCPGNSYNPPHRRHLIIARTQTNQVKFQASIERLS